MITPQKNTPQPAETPTSLSCRAGCGACCIAPSISSPLPKMPQGKPAGVRCAHLDTRNLCELFGQPERPAVCLDFQFDATLCGEKREQALEQLLWLEDSTRLDAAG
ncbi:YkgJ family cysteine cluster protein [Marinospirillum sp.]|uniref:YkgJ family cysteine cluster protein n=1 Tax=Marinospirillum sp. TaxID=2183934 RepID=UPI003A876030